MWSKHSKVLTSTTRTISSELIRKFYHIVIARNALQQEESEEFSGDFQDPINIHLDNEQGGCAC